MKTSSIVLFAALAAACSNNPPPMGGGDASKDTSAPDVAQASDASEDATPSDANGNPDSSGGCTLSSPPSNSTCAACLQASCCDAWNTCSSSSDCVGYVACIQICYPPDAGSDGGPPAPDAGFTDGGDNTGFACAKNCEKQYPNGINDGIVVADCESNACAGKCP